VLTRISTHGIEKPRRTSSVVTVDEKWVTEIVQREQGGSQIVQVYIILFSRSKEYIDLKVEIGTSIHQCFKFINRKITCIRHGFIICPKSSVTLVIQIVAKGQKRLVDDMVCNTSGVDGLH
jgi:hypothetical protein